MFFKVFFSIVLIYELIYLILIVNHIIKADTFGEPISVFKRSYHFLPEKSQFVYLLMDKIYEECEITMLDMTYPSVEFAYLAMFAKDPTKPDTEDNRTYRYVEAKKGVRFVP